MVGRLSLWTKLLFSTCVCNILYDIGAIQLTIDVLSLLSGVV